MYYVKITNLSGVSNIDLYMNNIEVYTCTSNYRVYLKQYYLLVSHVNITATEVLISYEQMNGMACVLTCSNVLNSYSSGIDF